MKKVTSILLACVMLLALAACGQQAAPATEAPQATEAPTEPEAKKRILLFLRRWGLKYSDSQLGGPEFSPLGLKKNPTKRDLPFTTM